jgi:hypothetical protein
MKVISTISNTIGSVGSAIESVAKLVENVVGADGLVGKTVDQVGILTANTLQESIVVQELEHEHRMIALREEYNLPKPKKEKVNEK